MSLRRVRLSDAEIRAIRRGRFVRVDLGAPIRFAFGASTRSALVGEVGGHVRAWANLCQHNPAPLDLGEPPDANGEGVVPAPMADDGVHFMCHSHGALFRPKDGLCVLGPCFGQRLHAIDVDEDGAGALSLVLASDERA